MFIKRQTTFNLHTRKPGDAEHGKNLGIRMRVRYDGKPLDFPLGFNCDALYWDTEEQCVKRGFVGKSGQTTVDINQKIETYKIAEQKAFARYELIEERKPTIDEITELINDSIGRQKPKLQVPEIVTEEKPKFYDIYDLFVKTEGNVRSWESSTFTKFRTLKRHLQNFDKNLDFETLTEDTMQGILDFLLDKNGSNMINSTAMKQMSNVKWFIRWAYKKDYYNGKVHEAFNPKLKGTGVNPNNIIFLEWVELMKLLLFEFDQQSLSQVRDMFCFCCFTSLRYSDVAKLKRSDVKEDHIIVTTQKTDDPLKIELNKYSRAILNKYKDVQFKNDRVLPVISNKSTNEHLKLIGKIAGIDDPKRIIHYKKNERIEEVFPKWALLSTHDARRTFVVISLLLGIPETVVMKWTGHSDFKAMKPYVQIVDKLKQQEMSKYDKMFDEAFPEA